LGKVANIGSTILGLAPMAMSAFNAAKTAKEGYDKVKLGRVHAEEFNPALIDPSYALENVEDAFATGNESMSEVSKKDYLRRRIQSATEESKAKSQTLGQIQQANTQMLNQAKQLEMQSKERADMTNLQARIQEENINAGNKGAWQTARDYQRANLATMMGEYARDIKMGQAQDKYLDVAKATVSGSIPGQNYNWDTNKWENIPGYVSPTMNNDFNADMTDDQSWRFGMNKYDTLTTPIELSDGINMYNTNLSNRLSNRRMNYNFGTRKFY
jgi:hypothetical protein